VEVLNQISIFLQKGNKEKVAEFTQKAIDKKLNPQQILDDGLIAGMNIIGEKFRKHKIFLPDVLLAAKSMYAGMDKLKPLFIKQDIPSKGIIVIGSVQGDLHDIGKNLVGIMLKGAGYKILDLGNDVAPELFVSTAKKQEASVIGMSTLLTTTMPVMKKVIDLLKMEKLENQIKTIIGGAPVSKEFAEEIGADAYGFDASYAVEKIKELLK